MATVVAESDGTFDGAPRGVLATGVAIVVPALSNEGCCDDSGKGLAGNVGDNGGALNNGPPGRH